jgi:hypothetical protein
MPGSWKATDDFSMLAATVQRNAPGGGLLVPWLKEPTRLNGKNSAIEQRTDRRNIFSLFFQMVI